MFHFTILSIRDLIRKFIDNPGRFSHKIRIILVERNKEDIIDSSIFNEEIRRRYYGSGIDLQPLSVESLSDLISDYVRNLSNKMIDEKSCKEIMNTLRVVDSQLTRPIYALIITEAWMDNKPLSDWSTLDANDYVSERELDRLREIATNSTNQTTQISQYLEALQLLVTFSTFIGEISSEELLQLVSSLTEVAENDLMKILFLMIKKI